MRELLMKGKHLTDGARFFFALNMTKYFQKRSNFWCHISGVPRNYVLLDNKRDSRGLWMRLLLFGALRICILEIKPCPRTFPGNIAGGRAPPASARGTYFMNNNPTCTPKYDSGFVSMSKAIEKRLICSFLVDKLLKRTGFFTIATVFDHRSWRNFALEAVSSPALQRNSN